MRNVIYIAIFFVAFFLSCQQPEATKGNFEVKRGTNVAHWLSQSSARGAQRKSFFKQEDVKSIAAHGFDHIRLPIDEVQMWDDQGNRHADAFELLENAIKWCEKSDLKVIIDLHIIRSHYFNAKEKPLWTDENEQQKFFDLWLDLSKTLKKYPNSLVAYELMNEAVADDSESWNKLLNNAIKTIRAIEPQRTIVVGSNRWQSVDTFDELRVPENDPNILLSFHFYEPFLMSHYHTSWTELKDYQGPVHYPGVILNEDEFEALPEAVKPVAKKWVGKSFTKASILEMWQEAIKKAEKLNLPLYCGEFGIVSEVPESERLRWYADMVSLFEEMGIGYANWNYKSGNYGLIEGNKKNQEMIAIVSGR